MRRQRLDQSILGRKNVLIHGRTFAVGCIFGIRSDTMHVRRDTLLCRWAGPDHFDTAEQEAMILTVRAVNRVACEAVSLIRNALRPKKPFRDGPGPRILEPIQDDSWVSFRFPLRGTTIQSVVVWVPEDDDDAGTYAFSFQRVTSIFQKLIDKSTETAPADLHEFIDAAFRESKLLRIVRWLSKEEFRELY
jgi:hypothetical protein